MDRLLASLAESRCLSLSMLPGMALFDMLQEPPLPQEWEKVFDLKTGTMYFQDRIKGTKTVNDPRRPPFVSGQPQSASPSSDAAVLHQCCLPALSDSGSSNQTDPEYATAQSSGTPSCTLVRSSCRRSSRNKQHPLGSGRTRWHRPQSSEARSKSGCRSTSGHEKTLQQEDIADSAGSMSRRACPRAGSQKMSRQPRAQRLKRIRIDQKLLPTLSRGSTPKTLRTSMD
eukprot:SM000113S24060  [mRNA]  locus=s113:245286:246412:- [translate_table: standard]